MNERDSNGLKQGYWVDDSIGNVINKGHYIDDLKHGKWTCFRNKGNEWFYYGSWEAIVDNTSMENLSLHSITNYKDGIWHGEMYYFYENGNLSYILNYREGLMDGERLVYFNDGKTLSSKSFFINDMHVGIEIYYNIDGSTENINFYL